MSIAAVDDWSVIFVDHVEGSVLTPTGHRTVGWRRGFLHRSANGMALQDGTRLLSKKIEPNYPQKKCFTHPFFGCVLGYGHVEPPLNGK